MPSIIARIFNISFTEGAALSRCLRADEMLVCFDSCLITAFIKVAWGRAGKIVSFFITNQPLIGIKHQRKWKNQEQREAVK